MAIERLRGSKRIEMALLILERVVVDDTVASAEQYFYAVLAFRAGMRKCGRFAGDAKLLDDLQRIVYDHVTRENSAEMLAMLNIVRTSLGVTIDDWRSTARRVLECIVAQGYWLVELIEIRPQDDHFIAFADGMCGDWPTRYNLQADGSAKIGDTVLVPRPACRPEGPPTGRHTSIIEWPVTRIHPDILPR